MSRFLDLVFHDCTPPELKLKLQNSQRTKQNTQVNDFLKYLESIRVAPNIDVPVHQTTTYVDDWFKEIRSKTNKNLLMCKPLGTNTMFQYPPSQYELMHTDIIHASNVPPFVKQIIVQYYAKEILAAVEYTVWSRMQSGFTNFVKNLRIGIVPEMTWRYMFYDFIYTEYHSRRKSIINCVKISDEIEHKKFNIKTTGFPPLLTKFWYQKSFRHGNTGDIFCCTVQQISFSWNFRTHFLDISFDYITEHLNTFSGTWNISG